MKAIIAINNKGYIGLNDKMIWHSKEDFKHFKTMTEHNTCLVGYNTFKNLPDLKNRTVILDQKNHYITDKDVWCIGGKKTYEKYMRFFTEVHISVIDNNDIGDTMTPDFSMANKDCRIFYYNFK